jgi:pimeloyl-ACP methyl ester carboxylesterase
LGIEQAYIGGLSMGGSVTVSFGIAHPERCRALIVASAGSGTTDRENLLASWQELSELMLTEGMEKFAEGYASGPERVQFRRKDPVGWEKFRAGLAAHSARGSAYTFRGVQMKRPTIYELESELRQIDAPALVLVGDEDEPCLEPGLFMKHAMPRSGLAIFPQSGHTINLEEPALFNQTILDFLTAVEADRWPRRGE